MNFLQSYKTIPHATTGKTPSQLFLKGNIRTQFDLLKPDSERRTLVEKQSQQTASHDKTHSRDQKLNPRPALVGQRVMAGSKCSPWTKLDSSNNHRSSRASDIFETDDRQVWKRHLDWLKVFQERTE